jgi:uncharacterized protein involved in response to NO
MAAWGTAASLLLLPLVAMQLTGEVAWTGFDFISAGVMIGGVGLLFELTVRMARNNKYRLAVAFALAAAFLIVWASGAVGMIGDEDNPYNLLFLGVIVLALVGAIAARFRASWMALAMAVAAAAHAAVSIFGMLTDVRGGIVSLVLAGPWLLSAFLFRKAAREQAQASETREA